MVFVNYLVDEVVYVQTCTAIYYSLYLVEELVELQALSVGDVVEGHLTVDALDNLHLQH